MQFFIGRLRVTDANDSHAVNCCASAKDRHEAEELFARRARTYGWGPFTVSADGSFSFKEDRGRNVRVEEVLEVSAVTFQELAQSKWFDVCDSGPAAVLECEEPSERVRTLSRRIGRQLTKMDAKVAHSKLLHAVAASIGETDWQVLVHQRTPTVCSAPDQAPHSQTEIPGTGFLYRVPVSVDTSMTAIVLARGDTPEDAIEAARQFAADGKARFEVDDGNYRGLADHYCPDTSEDGVYQVDEPEPARQDPNLGGAVYGPYAVELTSLGGCDDELLWADLRVLTADRSVADTESCLSACPVSATQAERVKFCDRVAALMYRCAPDLSKVNPDDVRGLFVRAVQGDQSDAAFTQIEQEGLPPKKP
ncbi:MULTISPECIES: hypothetical protein [unclassified Variovorax]|uniref:hypothetical protein n=1 Tax=unclassified Variovorax TaxID=663243 RepID=UPI0008383A40|nr:MULTISPECIES: hypothetical protein [unclassified Variovorax]PNG50336.1 hypothetical protein CHC06_05959 [Variovorax sp. B2]PNG51209.1 hypothetical protein CHC07_05865 [Variovorax sp. B4]VTV17432.1 hypothetical protein WDL1P1_00386 [Variovorax sp. WDL1]